jgi:hypothetical protein
MLFARVNDPPANHLSARIWLYVISGPLKVPTSGVIDGRVPFWPTIVIRLSSIKNGWTKVDDQQSRRAIAVYTVDDYVSTLRPG